MNLGEAVAAWARTQPSVKAVALIGSQARAPSDQVWRPDAQSDWDFQIFTSEVEMFARSEWAAALGFELRAYAVRRAAIGGVPKVAAVFAGAEADFVIVPERPWRWARWLTRCGVHRRSPKLRRMLQDLAVVIRPGWRFLKGGETWEPFYRRVVAEIADPRLSDAEARMLAEGFACDALWAQRKLERGELVAAQRMLHRSLAETNFRLLHELKLRRGERSFPEGRRAERVLSREELTMISVDARLTGAELSVALQRSCAVCAELMRALAGDSWRWPQI